jgi:hypothetical protein
MRWVNADMDFGVVTLDGVTRRIRHTREKAPEGSCCQVQSKRGREVGRTEKALSPATRKGLVMPNLGEPGTDHQNPEVPACQATECAALGRPDLALGMI